LHEPLQIRLLDDVAPLPIAVNLEMLRRIQQSISGDVLRRLLAGDFFR